jgi:hypothetical protein
MSLRPCSSSYPDTDTRSLLRPEVNNLFLIPNIGEVEEDRIGNALGYPIDRAIGLEWSGSTSNAEDYTFSAEDYTKRDDMKTATQKDVP